MFSIIHDKHPLNIQFDVLGDSRFHKSNGVVLNIQDWHIHDFLRHDCVHGQEGHLGHCKKFIKVIIFLIIKAFGFQP